MWRSTLVSRWCSSNEGGCLSRNVFLCSFLFKQEREKENLICKWHTNAHWELKKKRDTSDTSTGSRRNRRWRGAVKRENNNRDLVLCEVLEISSRDHDRWTRKHRGTTAGYIFIWQISSSVIDESQCFCFAWACFSGRNDEVGVNHHGWWYCSKVNHLHPYHQSHVFVVGVGLAIMMVKRAARMTCWACCLFVDTSATDVLPVSRQFLSVLAFDNVMEQCWTDDGKQRGRVGRESPYSCERPVIDQIHCDAQVKIYPSGLWWSVLLNQQLTIAMNLWWSR